MATFDKTAYRKNREAGRRGQFTEPSETAKPYKRLVDREGRWVSPKKRPVEFAAAETAKRVEVIHLSNRESIRRDERADKHEEALTAQYPTNRTLWGRKPAQAFQRTRVAKREKGEKERIAKKKAEQNDR